MPKKTRDLLMYLIHKKKVKNYGIKKRETLCGGVPCKLNELGEA